MLIVDREVDPDGLLASAAKPDVVVVEFDDDQDSKDELIAKIDMRRTRPTAAPSSTPSPLPTTAATFGSSLPTASASPGRTATSRTFSR